MPPRVCLIFYFHSHRSRFLLGCRRSPEIRNPPDFRFREFCVSSQPHKTRGLKCWKLHPLTKAETSTGTDILLCNWSTTISSAAVLCAVVDSLRTGGRPYGQRCDRCDYYLPARTNEKKAKRSHLISIGMHRRFISGGGATPRDFSSSCGTAPGGMVCGERKKRGHRYNWL